MSSQNDDRAEAELEKRMAALKARLDQESAASKKSVSAKSDISGFGKAMKMSSEFISAILVGAGIGYLIDAFVGTKPWAMIILLFLGFVAGVLNVLRASGEVADPYKAGWATTGGTKIKDTSKRGVNDGPGAGPKEMYDDDDQ